ncbi:MAG TPA: uroporphyrinogen decarboxylase family protein [Thermoproteota archaeon]|nr:uroporphyrinogen decarboxylase family protein [Thermoproteota archaeon]
MDSRERIKMIFNHEEPDRIGFYDSPWGDTVERWEGEGLPKGVFIPDRFGMDIYTMGTDLSPKYEPIVYEEQDRWRIFRDSWGVKMKGWRGKSGVPDPIEPVARSLDDFKERVEPLLDPELPIRLSSSRYPFKADIEGVVDRFQERFFVALGIIGPFELGRHMFGGLDKWLPFMIRHPKDTSYIFMSMARLARDIAKAGLRAGVDAVWVFDDVAYANGPFFSPKTYRDLLMPAHKIICEVFRDRNLPAILHTDGDVRMLIPSFVEAGFSVLQPLEAKANMDVRLLKREYGNKLSYIGNIDAKVLSTNDISSIEKEVKSKIEIAGQGGGYVVGSDHSVPPDVQLKTYETFVEFARRYGHILSGTETLHC